MWNIWLVKDNIRNDQIKESVDVVENSINNAYHNACDK